MRSRTCRYRVFACWREYTFARHVAFRASRFGKVSRVRRAQIYIFQKSRFESAIPPSLRSPFDAISGRLKFRQEVRSEMTRYVCETDHLIRGRVFAIEKNLPKIIASLFRFRSKDRFVKYFRGRWRGKDDGGRALLMLVSSPHEISQLSTRYYKQRRGTGR